MRDIVDFVMLRQVVDVPCRRSLGRSDKEGQSHERLKGSFMKKDHDGRWFERFRDCKMKGLGFGSSPKL